VKIKRIKKVGNMSMNVNKNPIIEEGISNGNEFLMANGKIYSPGNMLYDKYNGSYHIHKSGHICAGHHNVMIMQPSRFLMQLPKNKKQKNKLLELSNILRGNDVKRFKK
jgi:hypothetical protein